MKSVNQIPLKIFSLEELVKEVNKLRLKSKKIVFTNGVFDLLHKGHLASLSQAASLGDVLIVAVNSDASVKRLKGPTRPINDQDQRALMLASIFKMLSVLVNLNSFPS